MKVDEFNEKVKSGEFSVGDFKGKRRKDPALEALLANVKKGKKKGKPRKKREDYMTDEAIERLIDYWFKKGSIYIPYNVVSAKNSKQVIRVRGKIRVVPSAAYNKYVRLSKPYWKKCRLLWLKLTEGLEKPYKVGFYVVRYSKDRFDFHNMEQGPADIMQDFGWIDDDDKDSIKLIPEGHRVDKLAQGIILTPLKDFEDARDERI